MFKNYLKIAWRNMKRHKAYSFINITGLAIGMACCMLILLWVQDELSYDRFHENGENIYRVIQDINFSDHSTSWAINQGPLGPSLKNDYPEIVDFCRRTGRGVTLTYQDKRFDEVVGMVDPSLLSMFSFPLVQGDPVGALSEPQSIVFSEDMAKKYFPNEDPLGKVVKIDNFYDFLVTGVLKNIPTNSHLQFDFLIPFVFGREWNYTVDNWGNSSFTTYVQVQKGVSGQDVVQKISGHLFDKPTIEKDARLNLQPLKRIHLYSDYAYDMPQGNVGSVRIFSIVAFFILLIACINFMNLTTARSSNRAKEVGMRKVSGAYRSDIVKQFYGESILFAFVSLLFAFALANALLPLFNKLAAKQLAFHFLDNSWIWIGLVSITIGAGVIAGSYPALFLSSFHPVRVLKGSLASGSRGSNFRKVLVVTQFMLTTLLIIGTIIIFNQVNFMRNQKLGYDKEHLVVINMRGNIRSQFDAVKDELKKDPNILGITAASNEPIYGYQFSNSLWRWEGQGPDEEILMRAVFADVDYFKVLGMKILAGEGFSRELPGGGEFACVVNEEAARVMKMENAVGQLLNLGDNRGTILGVVKNYHFSPLNQMIEPLIILYNPPSSRKVFARLRSENITKTIAGIQEVWKKFAPQYNFDYSFLDESLDSLYRTESRIGHIIRTFSILAVIVSCLGLFGLASYMAEQRTKEIGVRKILGASNQHLVYLLNREMVKWVLVANIIAWPVAYLGASKWLQSYAYRINVGIFPFVLAALLTFLIALLTVSSQSIRSARSNPADSLRYE
ncbi:MAG: ABC transporter permease [Candidatus Aminicenantes bacterium]|nr:ABC transporter permease [Candidatus Aminicenantes bacterium]